MPHGLEMFSALLDKLHQLIRRKREKARKHPYPYPVVLVVRVASPVFSGQDLEAAKARGEIRVREGAFREVWLLAREDRRPGWPRLIRLDDQQPQWALGLC